MRIVALASRLDHVCARYRLAAFRSHFAAAGHELTIQALPRGWWTPWSLSREVAGADAVILQRRLLSSWQWHILRRQARRLIFDFDDGVFLRDSYHPRGQECRRRLRRFARIIGGADAVVAGNAWLRDQACRWTRPEFVRVIPTCVDAGRYSVAAHTRTGQGVRLVWIGSSSTLQSLEHIRPLLECLGATHAGLRLSLICDRPLSLRSLPVDFHPWSEAVETRALCAADIGIAWMPDDAWSRGKCGLKVLQYMAAGLPVVANPVGVHETFVKTGETGCLADGPTAWCEAIGRLAHDTALRRRLGGAGRRVVATEYDVRRGATHWLSLLEDRSERSWREGRKTA